jgi:hypothetical protein
MTVLDSLFDELKVGTRMKFLTRSGLHFHFAWQVFFPAVPRCETGECSVAQGVFFQLCLFH